MRAFTSTITALATSLFFAPSLADSKTGNAPCLNATTAQTVATHFGSLISNYSNASADAYLTSDFTDYSDSVIELMNSGCPNSPFTVRTIID